MDVLREIETSIREDELNTFRGYLSEGTLNAIEDRGSGAIDIQFVADLLRDRLPLGNAEQKVDGTGAVISGTTSDGADMRLRMVREKGEWKLDLTDVIGDWKELRRHTQDIQSEMERVTPEW